MPRTIPQIRERLHALANEIGCSELHELAEETKRRPPVRRARQRLAKLRPDQIHEIELAAAEFPDASYLELSHLLDINVGRISEVLAGKRDEAA